MGRSADTGDFWTRRVAAVRAETEAEEAARHAAEAEAERDAVQAAQTGRTDAEILEELGLPDPDGMAQGDDFAAFLRSAVPEHLRRRALRRLWRSNPVLANLDGLVDHGEDYTDAATVQPGMATVYQVGRGMIRQVAALAEVAEPTVEVAAEPVAVAPEPCAEAEDTAAVEQAAPEEPDGDVPNAPPRRHMRFTFETRAP